VDERRERSTIFQSDTGNVRERRLSVCSLSCTPFLLVHFASSCGHPDQLCLDSLRVRRSAESCLFSQTESLSKLHLHHRLAKANQPPCSFIRFRRLARSFSRLKTTPSSSGRLLPKNRLVCRR
jgi:hypothetical protein